MMLFYQIFVLIFSLAYFSPTRSSALCPDLFLVLAIDSSGSIDANEFAVQTLGYGAAFQNKAVQ